MQQLETVPDSVVSPLRAASLALVATATSIEVRTPEQYAEGVALLRRVVGGRKQIAEAFAAAKKRADETHRAIVKLEKDLLAGPARAEFILKAKLEAFNYAEEKRAQQLQAKIAAEEKLRREEALLDEAARLKAAGHDDAAEQMLSTPVVVQAVKVEIPKVEGISYRSKWVGEVVDVSKLKREFLIPNETAIRKVVESLGLDADGVLGAGAVKISERRIAAVRA